MIVDGRRIAEGVYAELEKRRGRFAAAPRLGVVVGANDSVIESFVRIKTRAAARLSVELRRIDLPHVPDIGDALAAIEKLAPEVDGIIVQLPMPHSVDIEILLRAIPPSLDVDGINPAIADDDRLVQAPVARAVEVILSANNIDPRGKRIVVVGSGRLVGAPVAHLLKKLGGDVSVFTPSTPADMLKEADIIVSGAGDPHFIKPAMIKDGVVLIDAGTSEAAGKVAGDADPACATKCALFTPVPGGVGPIAVAMIFENLFDLIEKK